MFGIITIASIITVTFVICYVLFNAVQHVVTSRRHLKQILTLPGREPPHKIWGHTYDFPGPTEKGLKFWYDTTFNETKEPLIKMQLGPFYGAVIMVHFDSAKEILRTSEPKALSFGGAYGYFSPWLGDGLLITQGKKWVRNRRLLTPAFHFDILKPYMELNNRCTDSLMDKMTNFAMSEQYFELFEHVSLLTLDVMLRCAFSYDSDCQHLGHQHPYVQAISDLTQSIVYRMFRPWLFPDWIFYWTPTGRRFLKTCDYVHKFSEEIIQKRKQAFKEKGDAILRHQKYIDFLDILLKARDNDGEGLSDIDIRNEVDTFLFEGHDTTASGISWTLYSLAKHPSIQSKCQKEVDALLEGKENEDIEWDDLSKLPFLTMCIKESMRLHTTVPLVQRMMTSDITVDGHYIPAKTMVEVNIYLLHHNPNIWDKPFDYIPERFTPKNTEKMDPYQYVPFSAGPRNCIGQNFAMHEMKVAIARIIRKFNLELDPAREVKYQWQAIMKTEDGMYMKAIPRL